MLAECPAQNHPLKKTFPRSGLLWLNIDAFACAAMVSRARKKLHGCATANYARMKTRTDRVAR
jgi:hypothetical protein